MTRAPFQPVLVAAATDVSPIYSPARTRVQSASAATSLLTAAAAQKWSENTIQRTRTRRAEVPESVAGGQVHQRGRGGQHGRGVLVLVGGTKGATAVQVVLEAAVGGSLDVEPQNAKKEN